MRARRALCSEYSSLIVRVEKRRGSELYINDGAYGALFDAAQCRGKFPVRALETTHQADEDFLSTARPATMPNTWRGPSPASGHSGRDYVEIVMLGAMATAMKTRSTASVKAQHRGRDEPMASLYYGSRRRGPATTCHLR